MKRLTGWLAVAGVILLGLSGAWGQRVSYGGAQGVAERYPYSVIGPRAEFWGQNTNVGATEVEVSPIGWTYTWPATSFTLSVASDSLADIVEITVSGIGEDYENKTYTVTTSGTTSVDLGNFSDLVDYGTFAATTGWVLTSYTTAPLSITGGALLWQVNNTTTMTLPDTAIEAATPVTLEAGHEYALQIANTTTMSTSSFALTVGETTVLTGQTTSGPCLANFTAPQDGATTLTIAYTWGGETTGTISLDNLRIYERDDAFWRRVNSAVVTSATANVGTITLTGAGAEQGRIAAGLGQAFVGRHTVRAGKTGHVLGWGVSATQATTFRLYIRESGKTWRLAHETRNVDGPFSEIFPVSVRGMALSDMRVTAESGATTSSVTVNVGLMEE